MRPATSVLIALSLALATPLAEARDNAGPNQRNLQATRAYYGQLIQGPAPRLAELTLFTTRLPKGGDLHHHYTGAIYAETYLAWAATQGYCIYRVTDPALKMEKFRIETDVTSRPPAAQAQCVAAKIVDQDVPFYRDLLSTWSDKDFDNHFHDQPAPDQQFFATFGYFGPAAALNTNLGLRGLKARARDENLGYLETMLRGSPTVARPAVDALLNGLPADASPTQVEAALAAAFDQLAGDAELRAKVDSYLAGAEQAAAGIDDADFKLRFLAYTSRNNPPAQVFTGLYSAFAVAARQQRVVGVNFVGPENGTVAMADYGLHMRMLGFLKQRFPNVRLALHAGELALGMVPPEGLRSHIRDAVQVAGAQRIGHGVDIAHENGAEATLATMRQKGIALEVNLTSNAFILGVKDEAHPLRLYRAHGVPMVISTDDAGVSRNTLSSEYLLYASRYKPSYDELKATVYNSLRYAFLSAAEKREETAKLDRRFADFETAMAQLARLGQGRRPAP